MNDIGRHVFSSESGLIFSGSDFADLVDLFVFKRNPRPVTTASLPNFARALSVARSAMPRFMAPGSKRSPLSPMGVDRPDMPTPINRNFRPLASFSKSGSQVLKIALAS